MPEVDIAINRQKAFIITAPYDKELGDLEEILRLLCIQRQLILTIPTGNFLLTVDTDGVDVQGAMT